jgi:hypothetical protein
MKPDPKTTTSWSTRRCQPASPVFRSARISLPTRFHDNPYEDKEEVDELDLNSDVSDIEADLQNTTSPIRLTSGFSSHGLGDAVVAPLSGRMKPNPKPKATTLSLKNRREGVHQNCEYVNSNGKDSGLEDPCSDLESSASWGMALSDDEREGEVVAFDDAEEWEVVDKELYDHTTNSFKQIPSTIFADESVQQTLMNYIEKHKPTEPQIEQFKNALGVLKFVAEFGYNAIKEPVVEWAEKFVKDKLDCGFDEVPRAFLTRMMDIMPQPTRNLLVRVPGSVHNFQSQAIRFDLTVGRNFRRHGFIEAPEDQKTDYLLPEAD